CGPFDWKIEVYRSGQSLPDETQDPSNDGDLNDHQEERAADDLPETAVIFDAWWTNEVDQDGDGCKRSGRLSWDPDVADCSGSLSVFEEIHWKAASSGTWTLVHTTGTHTITDCVTADSQYVDFNFNSDCGPFDWKIEIYRDGESSPDYARDPSNDAGLNDHEEERESDDPAPDIRVEPMSLSYNCAGGPSRAGGREDSYEALVAVSGSGRLGADVFSKIEELGGRILTTLDQRIIWCTFPQYVALDRLEAAGVIVAADVPAAQALAESGDRLSAAVARQFIRTAGPGRAAGASDDPAHPLIDDAWPQPPLRMEDYLANLWAAGLDPSDPAVAALLGHQTRDGGFRGNSDDMTGTVTVAVMFVESDGSIDSDDHTWTAAHEDDILAEIDAGLAWWAARATDYDRTVSFDVLAYRHTDSRLQQGYEPVTHPSTDAHLWVSTIMENFGYTAGDHVARVTAFNTWLRSDQETDRAYTAFVCYNPPPAPDQHTNGYAAWAYMGGPYAHLLYRSFAWSFDQVFTHETGHIFWACDEYYQAGYGGCTSCDHCSHGVDNGNCQFCNPEAVECMMRYNTWNLCTFTPGHLGWGPVSCLTIYNDGTGTLEVTSVTKPTWVTLNPPPPYSIASGSSQEVCAMVDCGACSGSALDDTLGINSNDPIDPTVNVDVHADCSLCGNGACDDGENPCNCPNDCPGCCTATDCDDDDACTEDLCVSYSCRHNAVDCDDGLFCNGTETCDALLGCQDGPDVDCNDDVSCTVDSCNEGTDLCDNVPSDAYCNNGVFCDGAETCHSLLGCQAGSDPCTAGEWCYGAGATCVAYGDGNFDMDSDVDLADFAVFQTCFGELGLGNCQPGNMTGSGVIELDDLAEFVSALDGP
ncbi:MAG: hypothetical protein V2A79_16760, partial [Planctomycetota bacterium]